MLNLIEILATIGTIVGFAMLSHGMPLGLLISLASQFLWIFWGFKKQARGIIAVNIFLIVAGISALEF